MEYGLTFQDFEIPTSLFTYPARFVSPVWAQGFECKRERCGLCCLTEKPSNVPTFHEVNIDKCVCRFYEVEKRLCREYPRRPELCRTYPFFIGVENNCVIISTSLECPGTDTGKGADVAQIVKMFREDQMAGWIRLLNDYYEKAVLDHDLWENAEYVRDDISEKLQNYFAQKKCFPFSPEITEVMYQRFSELANLREPKIPSVSVANLIKTLEGVYIGTRLKSYSLRAARIKGSKLEMCLFDGDLSVVRRDRIRRFQKFLELEIDKEARSLLNDYFSLILHRPYLSLAAFLAHLNKIPVPLNLLSSWGGAFASIDASATMMACRDDLTTVDVDTMREIISFCEGNVLSSFMRPDIVKQL
jgi:Fe-S-cluster containining protein